MAKLRCTHHYIHPPHSSTPTGLAQVLSRVPGIVLEGQAAAEQEEAEAAAGSSGAAGAAAPPLQVRATATQRTISTAAATAAACLLARAAGVKVETPGCLHCPVLRWWQLLPTLLSPS